MSDMSMIILMSDMLFEYSFWDPLPLFLSYWDPSDYQFQLELDWISDPSKIPITYNNLCSDLSLLFQSESTGRRLVDRDNGRGRTKFGTFKRL